MIRLSTILLLLTSTLAYSQNAKPLITEYFKQVRGGKYPPIPQQFSLPEYAKSALKEVQPFVSDSTARVRAKAYSILRYVGGKSRDTDVREKCVEGLLKGAKDKDTGNVGSVLNYLTEFYKQDFSSTAQNEVRTLLQSSPPHLDKVMRLAGFLQLDNVASTIQPYSEPGNSQAIRWSALLALARMGDQTALEDVLQRSKKLKMDDDVVFQIVPDLIYTHQRPAYDYIVEVLMSDEKNCLSSNPDREEPIQCGYRIMEQLAPVIEGYPLKVDESGDIDTDNYQEALATVRAWFREHRDYKIVEKGY